MTVGSALASAAFAVFTLMSAGALIFGAQSVDTVFGVAGVFMSIFEMVRQRESGHPTRPASDRTPFQFPAEQGLIGGLFGGVIAGLVIAIVYYLALPQYVPWMLAHNLPVPTFWDLLSPILIGAALIGAVIGILSLGLAEMFGHLARPGTVLIVNKLSGGIVGGLLAGSITGPLAALYYGRIQWPVLQPAQLLTGALPAAGILVFAILYFGRARLNGIALRGLLVALIATVMVAGIAAVVLSAFEEEILALLQHYIVEGGREELLTGGLFYGAFVGLLLGSVIGLTLLLAPASTSPAR